MKRASQFWPYSITASIVFLGLAVLVVSGLKDSRAYKPLTQETFIEVAGKIQPAVVSIIVSGVNEEQMKRFQHFHQPEDQDELMKKFRELFPDGQFPFNFRANPGGGELDENMFRFRQAGSGVIVRSDGYIVTNNHVIGGKRNAGKITVTLKDGRKFEGEAVTIRGVDELTDIAVLKIDAEGLSAAKWGDSAELKPGQWVLAVGDPLEFRNSVTQGIISAVGRDLGSSSAVGRDFGSSLVERYIQTTAIINPGNSGGALVDLNGEIVGLNQAISTRSGMWGGIGFAIPSNRIQDVSDQIIDNKRVQRGFVGIEMRDMDDELNGHFKRDDEGDGVLVYAVTADQAAEKGGVESNDVIVEIDGEPIEDSRKMLRVVTSMRVGQKVKFKVERDGDDKTLTIEIGPRPTQDEMRESEMQGPQRGGIAKGLGFRAKGEEEDEEDTIEGENFLTIERIYENSIFGGSDLRAGDAIFEVNGESVSTKDEVRAALEKNEESALVKFRRGGAKLHDVIELD